ncbi:DNA repair protein RadA [Candidatus Saccharibacteria bacterium]|nr:MAG: DNA repair protein RadA [Candidatus Saccharibacteria bacterium]
MAKAKVQFICQQCGATHSKWSGRCDQCGSWNSLVEQAPAASGANAISRSTGGQLKALHLSEVAIDSVSDRLTTGLREFDDVLGGGLMPGSVILVAGQPGIGKSTILLQLAAHTASEVPVLYVSGEESAGQVRLRADRLTVGGENLSLASSTSADDIAATIRGSQYKVVIVDSMQTIALAELTSAPGTVSQITNAANLIIQAAKATNTTVILVGHVTKEGSIAGPKVLEHAVDVVINLEGDRYGGFKIARAIKNRYGSTSEAALFEMTDKGLTAVENPSAALLAERQNTDGSVVLATVEGNRPLLVEIQALVNKTHFGYPKRTASGFDINRLNVLIAVLERRTKLSLSDNDVYINVVGGLRLQDPAADLAVCMAIASAAAGRRLENGAVVFGEVGLSGEIRSATLSERRINEAKKLGFTYSIAPPPRQADPFIRSAKDLREALNTFLKNQ